MERPTTQDTFPILGMSCAACAARVDKTLNKQPGVCHAAVNYAAATALVEYDPSQTSPEALQHAVQEAGYDLVITHDEHAADEVEEAHRKTYQSLKRRTTWAILLAIPIAVIGMGFMDRPWAGWSTWLLSTPVVFGLGRSFFVNAWKQLRHGSANMDTLVAGSTGVAYLFSVFNLFFPDFWLSRGITPHVYFESSSVIIAFILLGRLLEERAKGHTSQAIKKLMGLQPKTVTIVVNEEPNLNEELRMKTIPQCKQSKDVLSEANEELGCAQREDSSLEPDSSFFILHSSFKEVPIEQIQVNDIIVVKPGERMLSGEPVPVAKRPDDKVYAGTINQKGSFRFRAEKVGTDTLLAKVIHLVQDAHPAGEDYPLGAGCARLQGARAEAGGPGGGCLCADHHGHRIALVHPLDDARLLGRLYPRPAGPGDGAHHCLSLRLGIGYAHGHHGGHRQGSRAGHPH